MSHRTEPVEHGAQWFRPGQTLVYRDPIRNGDAVVEFRAKEGYLALVCSRDKLHRVPAEWLRNWQRNT